MESARTDQRRAAGLRTRARLMDAALDLIAARGEERVSLRELTGAADANVAAVSYHFGSLEKETAGLPIASDPDLVVSCSPTCARSCLQDRRFESSSQLFFFRF